MQNLITPPALRLDAGGLVRPLPGKALAWLTAFTALLVLIWDLSSFDLAVAHWSGGAAGFPLRDSWLLTQVLHDGARNIAWMLALLLCLFVWWPVGKLTQLNLGRRVQLASTTLIAVLLVSWLKSWSGASCPWDMTDFGGIASYASHWSHLLAPDGGSGRCFPAGHASAGFAFLGGYFALRHDFPSGARLWLTASIAAGLTLGIAQQMRGAHFMSHTLWTGLICWCVAWVMDGIQSRIAKPSAAGPTIDVRVMP